MCVCIYIYIHTHIYIAVQLLSCVRLFATSSTVAFQAPLSMVFFSQARILEPVAISYSRGSFQLGDRTHLSWKSPALWVDSLPLRTGSRVYVCMYIYFKQTVCRVQNAQSVLTFGHQGAILGGPEAKTSPFSAEGVSWISSLVGELRSHMHCP